MHAPVQAYAWVAAGKPGDGIGCVRIVPLGLVRIREFSSVGIRFVRVEDTAEPKLS